jgi:hypothetical protein
LVIGVLGWNLENQKSVANHLPVREMGDHRRQWLRVLLSAKIWRDVWAVQKEHSEVVASEC